ncbi:MAG TPA: ABC transporter ATP-binding protein [Phycisphaerae bacterium]|nr:ABC transporter ATP-binding protein [Phycisphaerae bacterium]
MSTILETRSLTKVYRTDGVGTPALRGVDLAVGRGEFVSIMGPSGCGKSTLLYLAGLLATPTEGTVILAGTDTGGLSDGGRTRLRRAHIGFVFQRFNLLGTLSAEANVALPLRLRGMAVGDRPREMLQAVGLEEKRRRRPNQLSVGEQQRVAIARALVTQPAVLLADEPTGNLDSEASDRVMDLVSRLHAETGQTVVLISHNEQVAARADRLIRMRDGRLTSE